MEKIRGSNVGTILGRQGQRETRPTRVGQGEVVRSIALRHHFEDAARLIQTAPPVAPYKAPPSQIKLQNEIESADTFQGTFST